MFRATVIVYKAFLLTLMALAYPSILRLVIPTPCTYLQFLQYQVSLGHLQLFFVFVVYEAFSFDLSFLGLPVFGRGISLSLGLRVQ